MEGWNRVDVDALGRRGVVSLWLVFRSSLWMEMVWSRFGSDGHGAEDVWHPTRLSILIKCSGPHQGTWRLGYVLTTHHIQWHDQWYHFDNITLSLCLLVRLLCAEYIH